MTSRTLERWNARSISGAIYLPRKTDTGFISKAKAWPWMRDMERLERQLSRLIAEILDVGDAEIKLSMRIMEDLGADSLETVELLTAIEEHFGIEVPDDIIERVLTVQDLLDYVSRRSSAPQNGWLDALRGAMLKW
jgi:acyl carrier protein